MFTLQEPTMDADVVAIMKHTQGYVVAIQKTDVGNAQICVESESALMDLIAELVTGDMDFFAEADSDVPPIVTVH